MPITKMNLLYKSLMKKEYRLVEKTPKNCFRISFINKLFSDCKFIFLKRDGRSNINSLIEGWKSNGKYVRAKDLPVNLNISGYIQLYNMSEATILHSPTLESVFMVEETIQKHSQECGKYQLWKKLPKKMMYQTFQVILDYLEQSGKIIIDKEGCVIWTFNPARIKRLIKEDLIVR